jgi:hypothetical protein
MTAVFAHALDLFNPKPVSFWTPYPKQAQAIALAGQTFSLLYGGAAGGGKGGRCPDRAAPSYTPEMETKVLTPKGWTLFGDIKVGDVVCNPDGTTARVIKVTDNGPKQFYRVTLADGSTVEADDEHLWAVSIAGVRKRRKVDVPVIPAGMRPEDEWNLQVQTRCTVVTTAELAGLVARADDDKARGVRPRYVQVPLGRPAALTRAPGRWPTFSPYVLGVIIGDGHIADSAVLFTSADQEIVDRVAAELPAHLMLVYRGPRGAAGTWAITRREGEGETALALASRDGLAGARSWDKHIPERIMWAPVEDRLAFAQGLMDTDGYMDARGHVEFSTVSERLAKDFQALLRSLGCRATLTTKVPTYTHAGEKREGRLAYLLYVQGRDLASLFHLARKAGRVTKFNGGDVEPWHRVVSVVPTVVDNSRCITVDNLNHLYVTDDYIVTHNSAFLRGYACDFAVAHPGAHIALVRRTLPMLKQTHGLHLPRMTDGHATENRSEFTFTFRNGSVIRFISLPNVGDEQNYKSAEFDLVLFDEVTELDEQQYTFMESRVRSARGHRAHVVATANPEGRGFRWVKRRWVQPRPEDLAEGQSLPQPGEVWSPPIIENGTVIGWAPPRAFLPATVQDNPGLMASNPMYVQQLMALPDGRLRRALLDGDWTAMDAVPGALWTQSVIDEHRVESIPDTVSLVRVVTGVDPSGSSSSGDRECGIVAVGLGSDHRYYVLEDASGPATPDAWAKAVAVLHRKRQGDKVVAERNYGGEMVASTLLHAEPDLPVDLITSSRGKALRAEPVSVLYARGMVSHVGRLVELEDQQGTWTPDSGWSPDRLDALVFAVTELAGGSAALAFLTQLSAPCPECKTPNTTGRATCFRCGKELPHAAPTGPAALPSELRPDGPPGVPGSIPIPNDPGDTPDAPDVPGPVTTAPDGTVTIAGLILPGR